MTIRELAEKMDAFVSQIMEHKEQIVRDHEAELVTMNREQMLEGLTAKGEKIAPTYVSFMYAKMKKEMNPRPGIGIPDLKLTGSFHEAMQMDIDSRSYSFFSTDEKAADLNAKYKDIFGLTAENIEKAKEITTRALREAIRKATGL